jgi:hypothetical protein
MEGNQKMQGSFNETIPDVNYPQEGQMTPPLDPLKLEIEDEELVKILDDYEDGYNNFYTDKYNLFERRKKNEVYYFGRQIQQAEDEKRLKSYESRYQDNVLYEIMGTVKPLAMSRVPDMMALPAYDSDEATEIADQIGKVIDTQIKEQDSRFVLGLAYKHLPIYFTSCIKTWWDNEEDDYDFGVIHPDLVKFDWTCPTNDSDKMKWVMQKVPATVQQIALKFPSKKDEFYKELEKDGLMPGGKETWKALATEIKYSEVWFTEYKRKADDEVERIDAVVWKYGDCILGKMKNPNFDYEGERRYFAYDDIKDENTKRAINESELAQLLFTGQTPGNVKEMQVYHNYFRFPRKPFFFMGYDQWGKTPMDETSWVEQNTQNQRSLDKRGKQIEETLDSRGHHIFSKGALTPSDVEEMDLDAPNVDLSVEGNVNEVHAYIAPERPTKEEFEEINNLRGRMYAIAHSQAIRGEIKAEAPATSNQIAREGDFTAADDIVEDTINPAGQWMGDWSMQWIKLRYTKDHFRWIMGVAGDVVYQKLNRNMIMEGMIVKIKSSGSDKIRAQNNALEMGKMQMTDPYTFFVDMGLSDPEGRTEKLILAKTDPMAYLQKVSKKLDSSQALAQALMNVEQTGAAMPQTSSSAAGPVSPAQPTMPQQGQPPMAPVQGPSPMNTIAIPQTSTGPPQGSPRIL